MDIFFAYIGPGAGIALVGSFLAVLIAMLSAMVTLLTWPVRWVWRALRGRKALARAKVRRVVVLGLDGLSPELAETYLAEGRLPNLARLRDEGSYLRLGTTWPPLSPVAWSSFSTGSNPGKHNIFDFLTRNARDYGPAATSVYIQPTTHTLKLGKFHVPLSRPRIDGLRKSKPFWNVLGEAGIFSAVLRVPITFPADKFHGVQLSAMCVPDLRGTQGTFVYFSESGQEGMTTDGELGGERVVVQRNGKGVWGEIPGPNNPLRPDSPETRLPFRLTAGRNSVFRLKVSGQQIKLRVNEFSPWVRLTFTLAPAVKVHGLCRFYLKSFHPKLEMYCTPLHIDPEKPVMPISHPRVYSVYLAKQLGPFATLGLAEDTWSLSEGLMGEAAFLEQSYDIHEERKKMFFDCLDRVPRGMITCVFDAPDRIQHMFWRFLDPQHPAHPDPADDDANHEDNHQAIRVMYERMDQLVGETLNAIGPDTALLVMSDHGFHPYRRGVDLNAWLRENGYLVLKDNANTSSRSYLVDVDWTRTRAFALGLAGIFLNQQGRESEGIVPPGEPSQRLVSELCEKLTSLKDTDRQQIAIHQAVSRESVYHGPYVDTAPDLIVGYNVGYRVSWDAAVGKCSEAVFSDNKKAWSGDHCIHPDLVPGVLFSNLKLDDERPNIIDLAPTTLELLGVPQPAYMDGKSLLPEDE